MKRMANVFATGATGSIGTAVLRALVARGHNVTALTRSQSARQKVASAGACPYAGDLRAPDDWARKAVTHDAIVHLASTLDDDMADADDRTVAALLDAAKRVTHRPRLIYTGGCWLYGATGEIVADEEHPFDPLPAFAWMTRNAKRLLATAAFSTAVIHPAIVYHEAGGAFDSFIRAARQKQAIEIWGHGDTRWPLIHRRDLADIYCTMVQRPDLIGHFNAVAEEGVRVRLIADHIAEHFGTSKPHRILASDVLIAEHGDWALGPTLDQQMSGDKLRRLLGWTPAIPDFRKADLLSN